MGERSAGFPYAEIVSRSWKILWRNPFLWLLGAAAGLAGSSSPPLNLNFNWNTGVQESDLPPEFERSLEEAVSIVQTWLSDHLGLIALIAGGLFVLLSGLYLVGLYFRTALVAATGELDEERHLRLRESLSVGRQRYWRFVGLSVLYDIAAIIVVAAALVPLVVALASLAGGAAADQGTAAAVTQLLEKIIVGSPPSALIAAAGICILVTVPLLLLLFLMRQLSSRILILDGGGIGSAITGAAKLFFAAPGRLMLLLLISAALGIAAGIVVGLVILLLLIPVAIIFFMIVLPGPAAGAVVFGLLAGMVFLALVVGVGGMTAAYFGAYWTIAYRRLKSYLVSLNSATEPVEEPAN